MVRKKTTWWCYGSHRETTKEMETPLGNSVGSDASSKERGAVVAISRSHLGADLQRGKKKPRALDVNIRAA
ncbi:hypothetical protein Bca4012_073645 [Brassica carinata]|uniref:Uncharacterized protein n=3 Tax=Brassica TaxID=3705 RepID=A0A8S9S5P9_BRACR|nr:hypothetical protein F2Q69_00031083 [Brassica cretica]KAF3588875.1 hypothetical protein F2Q69_00031085 [Brassica cretica]KAF3605417.1 hypothetical protein DY000_02049905 [Brassica cretica]KAG2271410.1 hypothetical protein Bca52824_065965 [Brassica carinata]